MGEFERKKMRTNQLRKCDVIQNKILIDFIVSFLFIVAGVFLLYQMSKVDITTGSEIRADGRIYYPFNYGFQVSVFAGIIGAMFIAVAVVRNISKYELLTGTGIILMSVATFCYQDIQAASRMAIILDQEDFQSWPYIKGIWVNYPTYIWALQIDIFSILLVLTILLCLFENKLRGIGKMANTLLRIRLLGSTIVIAGAFFWLLQESFTNYWYIITCIITCLVFVVLNISFSEIGFPSLLFHRESL